MKKQLQISAIWLGRSQSFASMLLLSACLVAQSTCFGPVSNYSSPIGYIAAFADFDHDGIDELVTGESWGGRLSMRRGLSGGNYGPEVYFPSVSYAQPACVGDFNRDGQVDVVACSVHNLSSFGVHYGNGNGGLGQYVPIGSNGIADKWWAPDLDRDGWPELIVKSSTLQAFAWTPSGWTQFSMGLWGSNVNGTVIDLADLDGDGNLDVAVSDSANTKVYFCGAAWQVASSQVVFSQPLSGRGACCCDLNRDGFPEILGLDSSRALQVVRVGSAGTRSQLLTGFPSLTGFATVDFDADGYADIAAVDGVNPASSGLWLASNANGNVGSPNRVQLNVSWTQSVSTQDVDRDGRPDLVIVGHTSGTEIRVNCTPRRGPAVTSVASGCISAPGLPILSPNGASLPRLGTSFAIYSSPVPVTSGALLVIGWSDQLASGVSLPANLSNYGMPNCLLYTWGFMGSYAPSLAGAAYWSVPVPFDVGLSGLSMFLQALVLDGTVNSAGMTLSNGIHASLGV